MTKIFEVNFCDRCYYCKPRIENSHCTHPKVPKLPDNILRKWNIIPTWCPLEDKLDYLKKGNTHENGI